MELTPTTQKFILHWGEMGSRWGINRTVAQIHALLFIAERPLPADEIAETLQVARSNVSSSMKELDSWGILHRVPVLGDRRDHFTTTTDVWTMFRVILDERKRREIDPTLELLRECVAEAKGSDPHVHGRLSNLLGLVSAMTSWYVHIAALPGQALEKFLKLGAKVPKLLGSAA
ncbi:MAG: MarR family transcriptional regulator [Planctomycetota bacterium]